MNYEMNTKKATVMAVHRERYELYAENEVFYGRLKTANFYNTKEVVDFPTVGDEVKVIYNQSGDSQIAFGIDTYCVSSVTGEGFTELEIYFQKGKTAVLLGSSGVGKSSFVNALFGRVEMLTGGIREADAQGRHTTTYKQCFYLPEEIKLPNGERISAGGRIIDTPGMRKLTISEMEVGKEKTFEDIESLISCCRFSDCQHKTEPGCAVRAALESGELTEKHWKTYLNLQREEAYAKARRQVLERRIEKAQKDMARRQKR